jgi:hypothetical protein
MVVREWSQVWPHKSVIPNFDLATEVADRVHRNREELGVTLGERRIVAALEQRQHVVIHEHLAVAGVAAADANGGDLQRLGQNGRHAGADHLQHNGRRARRLQSERVLHQLHRRVQRLALQRNESFFVAVESPPLTCTRKPPCSAAVWGVTPRCPITTIPALRMAATYFSTR